MASFSVISNIAAYNAQSNLAFNQVGLSRTLNRLSSGFRINYSGDDAAGLAIANGYRMDQAVLNQGIRNANDGLSTLQIKDGALNNVSTLLDRLSTLASQGASGSYKGSFSTLNSEAAAVIAEIERESVIAELGTQLNFSVYISTSTTAGANVISGTIAAAGKSALGVSSMTLDSVGSAQSAISIVKSAVAKLGDVQAQVGTLENSLQFAIALSQSQMVNIKAAESRIRDANIAEESANMARYNILSQSGIASLAQANQQAALVLSLLR